MRTIRPLPLIARHFDILVASAVLAAAFAIGNTASASPILTDRFAASASTDGASWLQLAKSGSSAPVSWTGPQVAGLSAAVNETLHAMAVGTLSAEPAYHVFSSASGPQAASPDPVPEPATLGLLSAGCLAVLAFCTRLRPVRTAMAV